MIDKIISHYKIVEKLGEGGMGLVYKAEDTKLKRTVALKFLPSELTKNVKARKRFIQEAQAASALDHPNICVIHEIDETEDGQMFICMAYYEGDTLEKKIEVGPLESNEIIDISIQVAQGLSKAHSHGIVHRDIKPGNIMITKDGIIKILDFGLAKLAGQVRITQNGTTVGTVAYMSPEQARGEDVDHQTDVWSYGVVMYEIVTGQLPFRGEYHQAVLYSIFNEEIEPLSCLRPEAPAELERIVKQALLKNKTDRYQNMAQLLDDLKTLKQDLEAGILKERFRIFVPFLEGTEEVEVPQLICVGREQELDRLNQFLTKMLDGKGQVVFVTGEAGSGKTTLIHAFIHRAQKLHTDLIVASGKCDAHTGIGDPYLPFRDVLRLLTSDVEGPWEAGAITRDHAIRLWNLLSHSVQALVDDGPDLIDTFVPSEGLVRRSIHFARGRAEWLTQLKKLVERKTATATVSNLQQSDLFNQYASLLQTLSREQPLLLIVDDLQWADAGSISLLFHLGRRIEGNRILVLGAFRPAEITLRRSGERHPLESVVNEFRRVFGEFQIKLDQAEGRHFVNAFIDTEPNQLSASFRDTLFRQTEGHALFTVELLRSMQDMGALTQDAEGQWVEGSELNWNTLPARIDAVLGERIGRLPENLKKVLTLASIEGEEFTAEVVARLHGTDEREMIQLLSAELDKRHNLVNALGIQRKNGQRLSQYRFRHVLFQKYLYTSLDEVERLYLHEEVGTVLENLYGEQADEIAVQLALHFREAGMTEKTLNYLIKAADQAKRVFANEEAIDHFQQALILMKQASWHASQLEQREKLMAQVLESLGDVQELTGLHDEARASFQEALSQVSKPAAIWQARLHRKIGKTLEIQCRYQESLQAYEMAETSLDQQPDKVELDWWHEWIEIHNDRLWLHYVQDQLNEMSKLAEKAQYAIEQYATPAQRSRFFLGLLFIAFRRDRYVISDETMSYAQTAFSASQESGDPSAVILAQFNLGFTCLWYGDLDRAEKNLKQALDLTEKSGNVEFQSRCLTYLTVVFRKRDLIEQVQDCISRCEEIATTGQMYIYIAMAKANRSWVAWHEGSLTEAEEQGQAALELWKKVKFVYPFKWAALLPLMAASVAQDQIAEAIDYARTLLDSTQMCLPDELTEIVEKAINTWDNNDIKETRNNLDHAIELAQQMEYL
ncbi:MAG: DUF2791 family P-loop domain-containing protein [bacterium]|nr:MAG: DUF2791 family P-loop domain-containing protein [bacterium]